MTKQKSTKKTLLTSVLSLVLCMAMLIGTTFAWFTDNVTSKNNIIKSGNLDVTMEWADGMKAVPADNSADWTDASAGAIFDYDLWEPGYTEVRHIKIANAGTLAFKYQLNIVANGEVSDLADVIDVYYVDPATQITNRAQLTDANKIGTLTQVLAQISTTASGDLLAGEDDTVTIALKMQESAGNEYQGKSIGADFSIQVLATQLTSESDSFNNQYDALASVTVGTTAELIEAINDATGNTIVYLKSGEYAVNGPIQINKGQTVTLYGIGEVTLKQSGGSHIFNVANESTATFQNLNLDGNNKYRNGIFVRGNSNVTLINTDIKNTGHYDICIDQVSDKEYSIEKTATVTLYDSNVEDVSACAFPVADSHSYSNIEGNSYVKFVYDSDSSVGSILKENWAAAENIYINGDNGATGTMVASGVWKVADKTYAVHSKEGLINLESVLVSAKPSEANILTVELMCDVDLVDVMWDTIDCMWIIFNGNTHTISNINCGKDSYVGRSGFWGYAGAVTMNNLTLENVTSCGTQAGVFAGSADGLKLNNCYLKGVNTVEWEQNAADAPYHETASGIGAITGVTINSNMNVEIIEGAKVTLVMNEMPTVLHRVDNLVGHKVGTYSVNSGNIVNNGIVTCLGVYYISVLSADELKAAVDAGATNLWLADGEYDVYGCGGKTLTISGTKNAVITPVNEGEYGCDYGFDSATVTFNGVTIDTTGMAINSAGQTPNYPGFARINATYNNCNFNGTYAMNKAASFIKCTFNVTGDKYNLWTWGADKGTFTDCTFNCDGKSVLVYNSNCDLTFTRCTFNDNGTISDKAAIETGADYGSKTYNITLAECNVNGFDVNPKGSAYKNIVGNKNNLTKDYLNVVIDGVDVY